MAQIGHVIIVLGNLEEDPALPQGKYSLDYIINHHVRKWAKLPVNAIINT